MVFSLKCEYDSCSFETSHDDKDVMLAQYSSHQRNHENAIRTPPTGRAETSRAAKAERPKISSGCSEESWNMFLTRWKNYKRTSGIPHTIAAGELFECCDTELGDDIIKQNSELLEGGETPLLEAIKKLAVIPTAVCVRRSEVLQLKQEYNEGVRSFYAKIKGKADTCAYTKSCPHGCNGQVDYTSEVIKDVLISGLADQDIRKDVLGWQDLDSRTATQTVTFVESKEMARNALSHDSSSSTSAINSAYRKMKQEPPEEGKEKQMGKCPKCNKQYPLYKFFQSTKRWNPTPFTTCFDCRPLRKNHRKNNENNTNTDAETVGGLYTTMGVISDDLQTTPNVDSSDGALDAVNSNGNEFIVTNVGAVQYDTIPSEQKIVLRNQIFSSDLGWKNAQKQQHPRLRLRITTKEEDYHALGIRNFPKIAPSHINVVTDSGAQSCLWGLRPFLNCGFKVTDLVKVDHRMCAANKMPIKISGAIVLRMDGEGDHGTRYECAVMVFISQDTDDFFLSKEAMQQLAIIPKDFPKVGAANISTSIASTETKETLETVTGEIQGKNILHECNCPKRVLPPGKPLQLPFEPIPENNERFKLWLLDRYKSSTFNQCPHQELPKMVGPELPPLKIHVHKDAIPVVHHKPGFIPLHFYDEVISDLRRDIAMGVLEVPPLNEPVTWCHKMVIATKTDGNSRRCVDMSGLNKQCAREPHIGRNPFEMARAIPRNTVKSVQDGWNGFHVIPIREEDRHLTTFQTPIGLLRYARAPQGALGSGDGYNQRWDIITMNFKDKERCVDDTAFWDDANDLEGHWWRNIEFIELAGRNGSVLNPKKFQCAQKTIDFAGFRVTESTIEPLPKYIDSIRNFPKPCSITDIRAWFGLTNQVAHYAQLRELVAPMKPLLKKNAKFEWTMDLDVAFETSKEKIIEAIKKGV